MEGDRTRAIRVIPHVQKGPDGISHDIIGEIEKPREKPLIYLVLVDSERAEFGLVKDYSGNIAPSFEGGTSVGVWNKIGEGTFYLSLTTPIEALQDSLIKHYEQVVKERTEQWSRIGKPKPTADRHKLQPVDGYDAHTNLDREYDEEAVIKRVTRGAQPSEAQKGDSFAELRAKLKGG